MDVTVWSPSSNACGVGEIAEAIHWNIPEHYGLWGDEGFPEFLRTRICQYLGVDLSEVRLDPNDSDLIRRHGIQLSVDGLTFGILLDEFAGVASDAVKDYAKIKNVPRT